MPTADEPTVERELRRPEGKQRRTAEQLQPASTARPARPDATVGDAINRPPVGDTERTSTRTGRLDRGLRHEHPLARFETTGLEHALKRLPAGHATPHRPKRSRASPGSGGGRLTFQRSVRGRPSATDRVLAASSERGARRRSRRRRHRVRGWDGRVPRRVEHVRAHLLADAFRRLRAEACPEPSAHDDAVDVQEIDDRGAGSPNRVVGVIDQLARERVVLLECACPHAARQTIPVRGAHEVEQLRPLSAFMEMSRPRLHRRSACIRLDAATTAARTDPAAELDHGVAQLARSAVPFPAPTCENDTAAETGPPPDSKEGWEVAARAKLELRRRGGRDIVRHQDGCPDEPSQIRGKGVWLAPAAREIRVEPDSARIGIDGTG